MIERRGFFNWIKGLQSVIGNLGKPRGNKKCRELVAAFFDRTAGSGLRPQAFLRMNSPIIGQMISRQRRPEKMP
jgi:hypothetical protein